MNADEMTPEQQKSMRVAIELTRKVASILRAQGYDPESLMLASACMLATYSAASLRPLSALMPEFTRMAETLVSAYERRPKS